MTERGGPPYWSRVERQKEEILNIRADAARRRTRRDRRLSAAAHFVARPAFFAAEAAFHLGWVGLNLLLAEPARWDPFPFALLGGLASVQALFIGLLILMYEEREARVAELREETELQVNLHAERETTKLLRMVAEIHRSLGVRSEEHDEELREMAQPLDPERLREVTEDRLQEAEEE